MAEAPEAVVFSRRRWWGERAVLIALLLILPFAGFFLVEALALGAEAEGSTWPLLGGLMLLLLSVWVVWQTMQRFRPRRYVVGARGIVIPAVGWGDECIPWNKVQCVDVLDPENRDFRRVAYVHYLDDSGVRQTLSMPVRGGEAWGSPKLLDVLGRYWPDFNEPWQEQVKRRGTG